MLVHGVYMCVCVCVCVMSKGTHFLLSKIAQSFSEAPVEAVAVFNLKGVTGYIRLQTVDDVTTRITTNVQGLPLIIRLENGDTIVFGSGLNWHIHRFPVDLTLNPEYRCLNEYVGGHYDPFMVRGNPNYITDCSSDNLTRCEVGDLTGKFGRITENEATYNDNSSQLQLGGRNGVVGRSIVIHAGDGTNFVCATIRSVAEGNNDAEVVTLSATFVAPVGGVMYLRQVNNEHAVMFGKVFWVNGVDDTEDHNWHIHENLVRKYRILSENSCP